MTLHCGIIGAGNISETHARAASEIEGLRVAAIYGRNSEKAERMAGTFGGKVYTEIEEFLNHKPLDIVAIGSPSGLHAEQGIMAARRGIHVLVEKPIDISTARADALISECEKAGVKLGVFFQDRVSEGIVKLKQLVDQGTIGRPLLASARVRWYRPAEYYTGSKWRGTWELDGGGALMNQGVHTIDLLLWLLGPVSKVYARAVTALHRIEVEDTVVATIEFESSAVATFEATTAAYPGYPRRLEISGTEGTVTLEHDRILSLDLKNSDNTFNVKESNTNLSASSPVVSDVRGHRRLFEDFIHAIQTNSRPVCDGREARRSVELIEAIYSSSRTGEPVVMGPGVADQKSVSS
jgi:UDP-N-acetyl-2-amino-2-deoxyglucuronate dehydrogenase